MSSSLEAGAARRVINPPLGTGKGGVRLFGDPIQAFESDLTATVLVLSNGDHEAGADRHRTRRCSRWASRIPIRGAVAAALGVPVSHVLFNVSHNHSAPALPECMAMTDEPEDARLRIRYARDLRAPARRGRAARPDCRLQPARIGTGWGESSIGVYRREQRDGSDVLVLGEVPGHPIDASVGVMRVDDLDGRPIAVAFRYSAHPVVVGGRSAVGSTDYPGPARDVLERSLGGLGLFFQGCGGNIEPRGRDRLGDRLPRHQEPGRAGARRRGPEGRCRDPHRIPSPASVASSGTSRTSSSRPGSP